MFFLMGTQSAALERLQGGTEGQTDRSMGGQVPGRLGYRDAGYGEDGESPSHPIKCGSVGPAAQNRCPEI